jgi:hypothetical protein
MRDEQARKRILELEYDVAALKLDLFRLGRRLHVGAEGDLAYWYAGPNSEPRGLPVEDVVRHILRHLGLMVSHKREMYTVESLPAQHNSNDANVQHNG